MKGAYFRLMEAANTAISKSDLASLDFFSRAILDFVGCEQAEGRNVRVGDIIKKYKSLATAPTIYWRLSILEGDGWIYYRTDPADARAKLVKISDRAKAAYARLDRAVASAMIAEEAA